ncbi:MAG: VWA domain-containing protein [Deltaproteobacteria bacterium]|nr:VWA domain-containing protein [Deltaproteobacteria bacterium]
MLTLALLLKPATSAAQDGARINQDGTVDFTVYLAFPPTSEDIDRVESMLRASSELLCDATDGDLRFGEVKVTTAAAAEGVADVWMLPDGLWSQSGYTGFILDDDSRVFLSDSGRTTLGLMHELGHAILGLPDAYDNQNYKGTYFGIGYARDPGTCANYPTPVVCVSDQECGGGPGDCVGSTISAGANTIMSYSMTLPRCSMAPTVACPMGDIDCAVGQGTCEPPPLQSEILPNNLYDDEIYDVEDDPCPAGALSGKTIELHGHLDMNSSAVALDLSSLGDAKNTAGHYALMRYFDQLGAISGLDQNSNHDLWMFAELETDATVSSDNVWRLHFVMESKHILNPPPNAELVELGSVRIDFNGGSSTGPYSSSSGDTALVLEECDGNGVCAAPSGPLPTITIPTMSNNAASDTLEVEVNLWQLAGADKLGWSRILAANDDNQRGDCTASRQLDGFPQIYCEEQCKGMWTESPKFRWVAAQFTRMAIRNEAGAYSSEWARVENLPADFTGGNRLPEDSFNASITPHGTSVTVSPSSSGCDTADDINPDMSGINAAETLIVLMDRSDSMTTEYDSFGQTASRFKWAQGAAEALGVLVQSNNDGGGTTQQIGLVTFSHETEDVFGVQGLLSTGTTAIDFEDSFENLSTQTSTALSRGLERAGQMAAGKTNPAIIVLTDGEPNICLDGTAKSDNCDPMQEAIDEACQLNANGVQVYYTPLNNDMGGTLFAEAGGCGPSANHASSSPRQIPLQFGRSYLNFSGIAPIVDGDPWSVGNVPLTTTIPVEEGATKLTIMLTSRADDLALWDVGVDFNAPSGTPFDGNSPGVTEIIDDDHVYHIVTIDNPEAGTWVMRLWSDNANTQDGYTLAWTNTPEPDLHVGVSTPTVTNTNLPVDVRALPSWRTPIDDADCEIDVERPDGSVVGVSLEPGDSEHPAYHGQFSAYNGRGVYRVRARCESTQDSRFMMLDAADSPNQTIETPPAAPEFVRAATTTFFVDMPSTSLPPGGDCDGDGRSDSAETPPLDTDGDGLIDACDPDSDNDEISDAEEGLGDLDGDGLPDVHDIDADDDGEHDSVDWDHLNDLSYLLHTVGDFDGDGHQDRLWGEPDYDSGRGRIVVDYADDATPDYWHRETAGILGTAAVDDNFGAVVVAGDFNDDGYDDVAIGAPLADFGGLTQAGEIHIIYGSSGGLTSIGDQLWNTDSAGMYGIGESDEYFGSRMSVGDFNCDGYDDIVVGMPDEVVGSVDEAGVIHAIYGSSGGITSTGNDLYYQGYSGANGTPEANDRFGETLAVGDFDNDTCSDVVIGVPGQDSGAINAVGEAYVMYGDSSTGVTSTGDWTFTQGTVAGTAAANDRFGTRLWAFDVDSNGYDDVVVMTPGDCSANEKGFNYVYGGSSGLSTSGNTHTCEEVLP